MEERNPQKGIIPPQGESQKQETKIIKLNPAPVEYLTAYGDEFLIPHIKDGQDVKIGKSVLHNDFYLRCDFSVFAERLEKITPEILEKAFLENGKLERKFPNLDENTRKLLYACWVATILTRRLIGDIPSSPIKRDDSFYDYQAITMDGKDVCVKPLSESRGYACCSEYSLMAHHILEKLGIQSSVVVGAFSENPKDQFADRHTFLVLEGGKYVFDPTLTALQKDSWPPKVFTPETPLTVDSLRDMETDDSKPFGRKITCKDLLTNEERIYGSGAV